MSEHDQPPFKPGDKFRWNECENQSEPSDAVHDVLNCYARPRRHAEEIVWLVESTNGGVYFADECEPVEAAGEANDELAELRRQLSATRELMGRKLAAVSVAAMMDTQFTHEQHKIDQSNEAWSPAYSDTMRRTAECIELRRQLAERDAELNDIKSNYLNVIRDLDAIRDNPDVPNAVKKSLAEFVGNRPANMATGIWLSEVSRLKELESQLATAKKQSDEFGPHVERLHAHIAELERDLKAMERLCVERGDALDELEAAAGAMRKLLLGYRGWFERSGNITFNQAAEIHQIDQAISSTAGRDYAEKVKALEAERDQLKQERDDWKRLYEIIGEAAKNNPLGLIAALKSKAVVFVDAT